LPGPAPTGRALHDPLVDEERTPRAPERPALARY
jgi:hypothetical protein